METNNDILKELLEIAPHLAKLEKVNAYQVPEKYFEQFKHTLLQNLQVVDAKQELTTLAPALAKAKKPATQPMPATYFTGFSGKLIEKVRADEVAKELAPIAPALANLQKVNTLQAPAGYFEAFAKRVLLDISAGQQAPATSTGSLADALNAFLDSIIAVVFKPKYAVGLSGFATVCIMATVMLVKVQQVDDLDNKFAQLSNEDINNYLDENKTDLYADEVFEMNLDGKAYTENSNITNVHAYKDALNDVDDAALNDAIAD